MKMYAKTSLPIRGFTLIELLVVVAIISLMSSIVLSSINSARQKARDAQRVAHLREIRTALELFYTNNGAYPDTTILGVAAWRSECPWWGSHSASNVIPGLVPTYMSTFPADPSMNKVTNQSCYIYKSDKKDYALLDWGVFDPGFNYNTRPTLIDPRRDGGIDNCIVDGTSIISWKVYSPGARCW